MKYPKLKKKTLKMEYNIPNLQCSYAAPYICLDTTTITQKNSVQTAGMKCRKMKLEKIFFLGKSKSGRKVYII